MRTFILVLAILLSFTTIYSQTKELGMKAGVSRTNILMKDFRGVIRDPSLGFSAGFNGNFWLQKHLFLSTGIFYERIGSKYNNNTVPAGAGIPPAIFDVFHQLDFIMLPLSLNYGFGQKNQFTVGAGAFGGYLLGAHHKLRIDSGHIEGGPKNFNAKELYHDFNFGLHFSGSYRLQLQKNKILVLAVEDNLGLADLYDTDGQGNYESPTRSLGFYASFLFTIK